jgi:hypothetical protein
MGAQEAQGARVGVQKLGSLGVGDGSYMAGCAGSPGCQSWCAEARFSWRWRWIVYGRFSPDGALTHHTTTEKMVY